MSKLNSNHCNKCAVDVDDCSGRIPANYCSRFIPLSPLKANMVEMAMTREILQYGEIKNVTQALSKRRLGL